MAGNPSARKTTVGTVTRAGQYGVQLDGQPRWYNYSKSYEGQDLEPGDEVTLTYEETPEGKCWVQTADLKLPAALAEGDKRKVQQQPRIDPRQGGPSDPETVGLMVYLSCLNASSSFLAGSGEDWPVVVEVARHFYRSVPGAPVAAFTEMDKLTQEGHTLRLRGDPETDEPPF